MGEITELGRYEWLIQKEGNRGLIRGERHRYGFPVGPCIMFFYTINVTKIRANFMSVSVLLFITMLAYILASLPSISMVYFPLGLKVTGLKGYDVTFFFLEQPQFFP